MIPRTPRIAPGTIVDAAFEAIRTEFEIPARFPPEVLAETERAIAAGPHDPDRYDDRTDVPFVTIDPESSLDLDQAFHAERRRSGYRIDYAIADPAAYVSPGGAIDHETHQRGVTLYCPDKRTPLHPVALSEDAASLLPDETRPAIVWQIDLDQNGEPERVHAARAIVRSRRKLSYKQAQDIADRGEDELIGLLGEIGELRRDRERERGAVSLQLPTQEIVAVDGGYHLDFDEPLRVEEWNAQISLLTGMCAANLMIDTGIGLLRTLPSPEPTVVKAIRQAALGLGIEWPEGATYSDVVRELRPESPEQVALLSQAARALRGAGYVAFRSEVPADSQHSAIASHYAHVTAPLRRLCDRFGNEIAVAASADADIPGWVEHSLDELPSIMGRTRQQESALDRAVVDYLEALVLRSHLGETFEAVVVQRRDGRSQIQLSTPAVVAWVDGDPGDPGTTIEVTLTDADPDARTIRFEA